MNSIRFNLKIDDQHYAVVTVCEEGFVDVPVNEAIGPLRNRFSTVRKAAEEFAAWLRKGGRDGVTGATFDDGVHLDIA